MRRRFLAALLCLCMVVTLLPTVAFAVVGETFTYDGVTYKVTAEPSGETPGTVSVGDGSDAAADSAITTYTAPETVTYNSKAYIVTGVNEKAFFRCESLESVVLSKATHIGNGAFNNCKKLTSVTLPEATNIGEAAFAFCTTLERITLPKATDIGDNVFANCFKLTNVTLPKAIRIGGGVFSACSQLQSIELPNATSIGNKAFAGCEALVSVTCGQTTAPSLGTDVFLDCPATLTVYVPGGATGYTMANGWPATIAATYAYNTPDSITVNGVTATVRFNKESPQAAGVEVTATVTLSGAAAAAGTHTINLSSTKAGLSGTAQNISVTAGQDLAATPEEKTFSFTVPAQAVDDLTLEHTFAAAGALQEQFTLPVGETYWFDLSGADIPGTPNAGNEDGAVSMPDTTLHYVPFTYAGTVNAYSRDTAGVSTEGTVIVSPRSLFVADYAVTHTVSWDELNGKSLIFGKDYASGGVNYTLRAPSVGSDYTGSGSDDIGTPNTNEWDAVLNKDDGYIKTWSGIGSWGQDTDGYATSCRENRGYASARYFGWRSSGNRYVNVGFRPVLEVLNPAALTSDGLKAVTLKLNGGKLTTASTYTGTAITQMNVVYTGDSFTAPAKDGLTRPEGNTDSYFKWLGSNGALYAPGDAVPSTVTALTAQWTATLEKLYIGSSTPVTLPAAGEYTWGGNAGGAGTTGAALPTDSSAYTWYVYNNAGVHTLTLKGANITTTTGLIKFYGGDGYFGIAAFGKLDIVLVGESVVTPDRFSIISDLENGSIRISGGVNDKLTVGTIRSIRSGISIIGCTVEQTHFDLGIWPADAVTIENATVIARGGIRALEKAPTLVYTNGYLWKASTDDTVPADYNSTVYTYDRDHRYFEVRPATHTVTLDQQSGTGGTGSVTAAYGSAMPAATMPTRAGYTFTGYFDAATDGTKYYNADGTSAKAWDKVENTTLYARWTYNGGGGGTDPETVYQTIEGAGGTWTQGAARGYSFTINAPFSRFRSVRVDGATVAASNYDKREGSTIITLHADYLETLSVGTHTLRAIFSDGYAQTTFTIAETVNPFTDVTESDWFYEDVMYARANGLMEGTEDTTFDPHGTTTRGMIVAILYRLEKEPTVTDACPFDDVASGKYYEKAVIWAAANGIVDGYGNGKFGPEDPITREQMAAILYRYEQYKGGGFTGAWMFPLNFPDANKVNDYAYEAMCWCTMNGIINGNSDGTLAPQGNAERCQVAAILHRFCENVK